MIMFSSDPSEDFKLSIKNLEEIHLI
jgi:hypothetical protein